MNIKELKIKVKNTFERFGYQLGEYLEFTVEIEEYGYSCFASFEDEEEESKSFWFDLVRKEDNSLKMANIKAF